MAAPPDYRAGVASYMARTAGDMGPRKWLDRNGGGDTQPHRHRFGGEVTREQVSELQDRTEGSRSLGHPVWEVLERTGRETLAGSRPD